jgi:2-polyprenyl-3-methyl-5-hydroxy-6-metoxy-1,4-benzoquinol methylase
MSDSGEKWSNNRWFGLADKEYNYNKLKIMELADDVTGGRLLDAGCNDGSFSVDVARHVNASEIYGIDMNDVAVEEAAGKGVKAEVGDLNSKLPFKDSFFSGVVSNQVLEHLVNTDNFFKEIHRVLEQDGYAIVSTQNLASPHNSLPLLLGMQPISLHFSEVQVGNFLSGVETHGHVKVPTLLALKDLGVHHGFLVEKIAGVGFYPFPQPLSKLLAKSLKRWAVFITIKLRKK